MSGHDDLAAAQPQEPKSLVSRRSALRGGAAAGIAGAAIVATGAPALAAVAAPSRAAAPDSARNEAAPAAAAEPIIAHVRNARTGEIDVFRGTTQTRLHDKALADLLLRASR
jgi:hypothetical protein